MTEPVTLPDNAIEVRGLKKTYAGSKKAAPKTALRGVELVRPLPARWRQRFRQDAQVARDHESARDAGENHGRHGGRGRHDDMTARNTTSRRRG